MPFMLPDICHATMMEVDTNAGAFFVPIEDFDFEKPLECTEGTELFETEEVTGWFARLSAPGYLDCTEWMGPYESEELATMALLDTYDVCPECGADLDNSDSELHDELPWCAECAAHA